MEVDSPRISLVKRAFKSGASELWRARLTGTGGFSRPVMVKRLAAEHAADPRLLERERAEALLTSRLVHPHILPVLDYCVVDGRAVTVLEDVKVVELLHLLERATAQRRRMAWRMAFGIGWAVLQALAHAHARADASLGIAGIAHGDLSPTNIFIDSSGRVLVRDFGIPLMQGKSAEGGAVGEPGARLGRLHGRPGYMCPELVTRGQYSPRSDVFALGILLFELVTFRRLFAGKDSAETLKAVALAQVDERITRFAGDLPMPLREVMRKALRRQPEERFNSAADMLRMLEAYFPGPGGPYEVASELAVFIADVAPPGDEEEAEAPGEGVAARTTRQRSGRRTSSKLILPSAAEEVEARAAEIEAVELWSDGETPSEADVEALLADVEPLAPASAK